jgi:hypothetical protein
MLETLFPTADCPDGLSNPVPQGTLSPVPQGRTEMCGRQTGSKKLIAHFDRTVERLVLFSGGRMKRVASCGLASRVFLVASAQGPAYFRAKGQVTML